MSSNETKIFVVRVRGRFETDMRQVQNLQVINLSEPVSAHLTGQVLLMHV